MKDTTLVVDRIEGDVAVLVDPAGRTVDLPADWLPVGVGEGEGVSLKPADVQQTLSEAQARLERLRREDPEGDLDL